MLIRLDMATDVDVDTDKNSNADLKFRCGHLKKHRSHCLRALCAGTF